MAWERQSSAFHTAVMIRQRFIPENAEFIFSGPWNENGGTSKITHIKDSAIKWGHGMVSVVC